MIILCSWIDLPEDPTGLLPGQITSLQLGFSKLILIYFSSILYGSRAQCWQVKEENLEAEEKDRAMMCLKSCNFTMDRAAP